MVRFASVAAGVVLGAAIAVAEPPAPPPVVFAPLAADVLAEAVRAEQDAYVRRLDVCTKLRKAAAEKADDKLAALADDLERQATALYQARVGKLGVKPAGPGAKPTVLASVNPLTVAPPTPRNDLREVAP
jgi:hypothetical protein